MLEARATQVLSDGKVQFVRVHVSIDALYPDRETAQQGTGLECHRPAVIEEVNAATGLEAFNRAVEKGFV